MRRLELLLILLALVPGTALAQARSCTLPSVLPQPRIDRPSPDERPRRTAIAGYLLAMSWSPEFCRTRRNDPAHRLQCSGSAGRFGFILHGLWPEAGHAGYPQYCRPVGLVPEPVLRSHLCMTPSVDLIQHEWAKHGSCGWADPGRYYRSASIMWQAVRFPDMDRLSRGNPNAREIRLAFAQANRGLPPDAVRVVASRRQWLREVHLCLGRDFRPRSCPAFARGAADPVPVSIWRGG